MERVIILKREKTALVVPKKEDCKEWLLINNLEISKNIPNIYWEILTLENEEEFYDWITKSKTDKLLWIYSLKDKKIIWNTAFHNINWTHWTWEFWIVIINKEFHWKWHWKEAIEMMLEFWFNVLWLRKINLDVLWNNEKAKYIYEKVWFKEVWKFKNQLFINWKYYDQIMMEIFREDWKIKK